MFPVGCRLLQGFSFFSWSCLWYSYTGSQGAATAWWCVWFNNLLRFCFLQLICFCWFLWSVTFCRHLGSLQQIVKWLGWRLATPSRSSSSKQTSLTILGSCSWVMGKWSMSWDEMNRWSGAAAALLQVLRRSIVVKRERGVRFTC